MISCKLNSRNFSLPKNILESQGAINQIKLMHKPNTTQDILVVVDDDGIIIVATIDKINLIDKTKTIKYEVINKKTYNPKIIHNDNSPWSVDCQYPYIIIGSNNRTVFVFNYETENNDNNIINNSFIYKGNENNIPYVTISENSSFIGNNSIDKKFKIFDFFSGELLCVGENPRKEWGWGLKFIPKNLFKIINSEFGDYEKRKNENLNNVVLSRINMSELNLSNPSEYDEEKIKKYSENELSDKEKYLKMNLIDKYYVLASSNHCAGLYKLDFKKEGNNKKLITIPIGKIELTRTYVRDLFMHEINLTYAQVMYINGIVNSSRYEFIFYSKNLNLFLLGSKAGDLQVYEMNIYYDKKNKMIGVEDEPNILITFGDKIAGMKFIENDNNKKVIDVFVLTLSGILYYYKIMPDKNFIQSHFDEDV